MEQRNNKQNSIIFEIENLLNKMSNQVNFLIRKEMSPNQLDIDLLMENTRKLYDTLCSVELGVRSEELGVEEGFDNGEGEGFNSYVEEEDEHVDMVWDFTVNDKLGVRSEELGVEEDVDVDDVDDDDDDDSGDYDAEVEVKEEIGEDIEDEVEDENKEIEEEELEDEDGEGNGESEGEVMVEEKEEEEEDSGIRAYRKINNEYFTLGDKLEQAEDNSLITRLQRKPVADLMTAIGINDKFLLLNELFGGSMEKYNKSIRSLNNFSTLLGAKTYMSELQIEFQWDCDSDAYKKLADLIERRFI